MEEMKYTKTKQVKQDQKSKRSGLIILEEPVFAQILPSDLWNIVVSYSQLESLFNLERVSRQMYKCIAISKVYSTHYQLMGHSGIVTPYDQKIFLQLDYIKHTGPLVLIRLKKLLSKISHSTLHKRTSLFHSTK